MNEQAKITHQEKATVLPQQNEWITNTQNAQVYDQYVRVNPYYSTLSRRLVDSADVRAGMFVVDLACGTGIVTQQVRNRMNDVGRIVGVDIAEPVLEIARAQHEAENVDFLNIAGEDLANSFQEGTVDRVLCNSAFWKMDGRKTLEAVHHILKPQGLFAFNLVQNYSYAYPNGVIPQSFPQLMRDVAQEFGYSFPQQRTHQVFTDDNSVENLAQETSYKVLVHDPFIYERTGDEVVGLFAIPAMQEVYFPNLDQKTRDFIHAKAAERFDRESKYPEAWTYYVLQKE